MTSVSARTATALSAQGRARLGFAAAVLAAPVVLGVARLLPEEGIGLGLRLAGAAACVILLPGALLLRATSWPEVPAVAVAGSLALSVGIVFVAFAATFAIDGPLTLTLALILLAALAAAVPAARARPRGANRPETIALLAVVAVAVVFAAIVWWAANALGTGDALFHVARARKLADADALTSVSVANEFRDGSLHPGYAFPLWHGIVALVAHLAGVDVADAARPLGAVLTPLALALAYAAGTALFRSWIGGAAVAATQVAYLGFSRGGAGSFAGLAFPASATRVLLVPALLALAFAYVRGAERWLLVPISAVALAVAVVHPTYLIFVAIGFAGFGAVWVLAARERRAAAMRTSVALAAALLPAVLFFLWLLPVVTSAESHRPSASEEARALAHYGEQLDRAGDGYRAAPTAITRPGPVIVAGLAALPLLALAVRRLWGAFAVGATLFTLAVLLVPELFTRFSDLVSISQSRRLAAFLPIPFAVAGAAVVLGRLRFASVPVAFGAGLVLQTLYPGDVPRLAGDGPVWPLWVATLGTALALAAALVLRRRTLVAEPSRWAAAAAVAFVLPIVVAGVRDVERTVDDDPHALTPGLVTALRGLDRDDVVFAPPETSYRVAAFAPVYVASTPAHHVANSEENRPYRRQRDAIRFFAPDRLTDDERGALLDAYGADWLLVDKARPYPRSFVSSFPEVYEDDRYLLLRVDEPATSE